MILIKINLMPASVLFLIWVFLHLYFLLYTKNLKQEITRAYQMNF